MGLYEIRETRLFDQILFFDRDGFPLMFVKVLRLISESTESTVFKSVSSINDGNNICDTSCDTTQATLNNNLNIATHTTA